MKINRFKKGQAALLAVTFLALVATISLVGSRVIVNEIRHARKIEDTMTAFFAAEAGIEDGLVRLKFNPQLAEGGLACTVINLDDGGRSLSCGSENDGRYFNNRLYRLKIWPETNRNFITKEHLLKDEILEFNLPTTGGNSVLGKSIMAMWNFHPRLDGPYDTRVRAYVVARVFNAHAELHNQFVRQAINNDLRIQSVTIPALPTDIGDSEPDLRLRVRTYFVVGDPDTGYRLPKRDEKVSDGYYLPSITVSISGVSLNTGKVFIESTGFYGGTQRTLKATLDTTSGQVVSLLDFAVYAGEGDVTK